LIAPFLNDKIDFLQSIFIYQEKEFFMSLIYATYVRDLVWEVLCPVCRKSIGRMGPVEIGELSKADIFPVCFDCSSLGVDKVPSHLLSGSENYLIGIDGQDFLFFWHQLHPAGDWELWCCAIENGILDLAGLENVSSVQSLSSSTYLHNFLNKGGSKNV
jgi:hypothetical protein